MGAAGYGGTLSSSSCSSAALARAISATFCERLTSVNGKESIGYMPCNLGGQLPSF